MDEKIKKNLFRKPTSADWISILMWIGIFALVYFYYTDINALNDALYECRTQLIDLHIATKEYNISIPTT